MRLEIKYRKGTYDVSALNPDLKVDFSCVHLRPFKAMADTHNGVLFPSEHPFDHHWLDMGTSSSSWWSIIGHDPEATGKEALLIERTDGPYAIVCLN